ncbi:MAG TPA: winged helix-turn-helix domain-containing protein [Mycobacteriales bacterium]|jgi:DNA-binding transcriptional ArsR family regulator|nr:winged helix-turn-helix domain-containing protein [Mycobacteriales bacterium]
MPADRSSRKGDPPSRRARREEPRARRSGTHGADTLYLQDARDIRALAHPARVAIIDALGSGDELTATECAELTGLSPSATAYHLKLLERYNFVEPAPARNDGRERPWRATGRRTQVDLEPSTPAGAAAAAAVALAFFDRSRAMAEEFIATEREEPEEWQDVAALANADLWLTAAEAEAVNAALAAVLGPYRERARGDRPDGTRRVRVMNMVLPHPRH